MATTTQPFLLRGLLMAYYWYDESLQNLLVARGFTRLPRTQSMIMVNISDGIRRPADLARQLGISRQAIQQTLAEMEKKGLVTLRDDPSDKRAKLVVFSERGKGIGGAALAAIARIERTLESRLGRKAVQALESALYADWGEHLASTRTAQDRLRLRGPAKPKR